MSSDSDVLHNQRELIDLQFRYIKLLESQREELRASVSELSSLSREQAAFIGQIIGKVFGMSALLENLKAELALIAAAPHVETIN